MAVLPVRLFGDPVLREVAEEVTDFDRQLRRLVADLTDTLRDERGSGLAAPQLGIGLRVFVFDVDGVRGHLINPVLDFPDDEEQDGPEGCLSIPGLYYDTRRRMHTVATGVDMHGRPAQVVGTAEVARCLQHETDHLDGVLFLDRLDPATRRIALRDIRRARWAGHEQPRVKLSPHPQRRPFR
ncbi:peptide deformylase [Micromonospora sp. WMMD1120]|uniref:peptide deformylase n=1 Tax=Micromonospora sp. WMMD1120 TaxID=3016106 RepID=UPI0024162E01|nr:peptide deformylase [Micromonospora sp. WMMD1120]MDG4810062.1 peptide deformylase [Micromonospora sp. WMMD1120]